MTEYWKSIPKYECKYCKVWITDNKPSREHHERGERHKEKVERKLNDLRKKGMEDAKQEKFVEYSMRKMEKAAMQAFQNDIKNDPELQKQYKNYNFPPPPPSKSKEKKNDEPTSRFEPAKSDWQEKTTVDGHTYFFNERTGEKLKRKPDNKINKQAVKENIKIERNRVEAIDSTTGIGGWETVEQVGPIDYGLPEPATFIEYKKADNNEYETKKENKTKLEFIEKTVSTMKTEPGIIIKTEPGSTGDAPAVAFKKRKMNSRSFRRKTEEESET